MASNEVLIRIKAEEPAVLSWRRLPSGVVG